MEKKKIQELLESKKPRDVKKITKGKNIKEKRNTTEVFLEAAKNAHKGGPPDLSTNDDYLYGDL